jgi:hypothetical protein
MQKSFRILGALALAVLVVWGWRVLFPNPERVIRKRLNELADIGSFQANESPMAKLYNAKKLGSFFTSDVTVSVDIPGRGIHTLDGRDSLEQAAVVFRQNVGAVKVEFLDVTVTLAPDKQSAEANLTGKATVGGERDFSVQEFNFKLKKVDGQWLIYRVESVKTLSQKVSGVTCQVSGNSRGPQGSGSARDT